MASDLTYNDIDVGKLINKVGLLELCSQIKQYVADNSPSSPAQMTGATSNAAGTGGLVPAPAAGDTGKFLSGSGIWQKPLFIAEYGVTTYADVVAAIENNAIVYCRVTTNGNYRMAFLAYQSGSTVEFQYYRSNSSKGKGQCDEVYIYTVKSSGWSSTSREVMVLPHGGQIRMTSSSNSAYISTAINAKANSADLATVATSGSYSDLSNKPTIPSIPASESTDGTYVLAETVSSGTATRSWQTMPSGGGTTYTAGSGISITNGVIALDLTVANGVSY